ncbi:MAG TPA: alpha/beta fold hydrolase [Gemmatimonadaceae bacterium]|nr:alpha/beta fold hydrolase [Gemmatimonadaceae bacterium]
MIVALAIVVLVVGVLTLIWWRQERILFQPPPFDDTIVESGRVSYDALDGQRLAGFVVGDPQHAAGVVLCFHGNADLAVWQLDWARQLSRQTGYAVFLAEYRGYMSLGGTPTYTTTRLDARAAYDHLRITLGIDRSRIAYFGHSLGSAIATELAEIHPPSALLLQSPFSSARAMARLIVTPPIVLAWRAISRIHFDTVVAVSQLDVPVSVAHGRHDRIVPFRMGLEVYQAAKRKGEMLAVETAGHNDVAEVAGVQYWRWITEALKPAAGKKTEGAT